MRIGVLGTGMVGRALATKLVELGHDVMMGLAHLLQREGVNSNAM
jgi:predicted dinucleotide-binding enzyme